MALAAAGCASVRPIEGPGPRAGATPGPPVTTPGPPVTTPAPPVTKRPTATVFTGKASWYGDAHHGKKTASGEAYDMEEMTAAHRSLPFGTRVRVTNLANGKSVVVRINDRGPFVSGRVIDLTRGAARELGMIEEGVADVRLTIVDGAGSQQLNGCS